eukprot:Nitzschia sp. Nitz4//scaffold55_size114948//32775//33949//NITZ4_003891-RA/size114948-processed-gene-0.36-mRNA-1//1//CDS//3329554500//1379//frame0
MSRTSKEVKYRHPFLLRNLGDQWSAHSSGQKEEIICYKVLLLNKGEVPCIHIEYRTDRICPFCGYDVSPDRAILKHFRRYHLDHHVFRGRVSRNGKTVISAFPVRIQASQATPDKENFILIRRRAKTVERGGPMIRKRLRKPWLPLGWDPRNGEIPEQVPNFEDTLSVARQISEKNVDGVSTFRAARQYYRTCSGIPMKRGDWEVDSDDESDDEFVGEGGQAAMISFDDVDEKEKLVLNLWNRFIRSNVHVNLPDTACLEKFPEFLDKHAQDLKGSREEILMMLMLFAEQRLFPFKSIPVYMKYYDQTQERK